MYAFRRLFSRVSRWANPDKTSQFGLTLYRNRWLLATGETVKSVPFQRYCCHQEDVNTENHRLYRPERRCYGIRPSRRAILRKASNVVDSNSTDVKTTLAVQSGILFGDPQLANAHTMLASGGKRLAVSRS